MVYAKLRVDNYENIYHGILSMNVLLSFSPLLSPQYLLTPGSSFYNHIFSCVGYGMLYSWLLSSSYFSSYFPSSTLEKATVFTASKNWTLPRTGCCVSEHGIDIGEKWPLRLCALLLLIMMTMMMMIVTAIITIVVLIKMVVKIVMTVMKRTTMMRTLAQIMATSNVAEVGQDRLKLRG